MGCDQAPQRSINTTFLQTKLQKDLHFRLFCNGDVNAQGFFFCCQIIHYSLLARSVFSQIGQQSHLDASWVFFLACLSFEIEAHGWHRLPRGGILYLRLTPGWFSGLENATSRQTVTFRFFFGRSIETAGEADSLWKSLRCSK